jgi:hypothetical protein
MSIFGRTPLARSPQKASTKTRRATSDNYIASGPEDFAEELEGLSVIPLDESPEFHPRSDAAGTTYVEEMGRIRAEEQLNQYRALGENLARPFKEQADEHRDAAEQEARLIENHQPLVELATSKYHHLVDVVGDALVRRHPRERYWYHGRMGFLLLGDLVGVAGGAIILGEIPWLAVLQAMAAAVAAITSGLLASEIKDSRLARQRRRDPKSLSDDQKRHAHLFHGPDDGEFLVRVMIFGSLTIVVLLGIGIFMLRSSTEGLAAGVVFGMIAVAVAMGSWVNTFHYTDELADKVEQAEEHSHRTTRYHQKLMALPARSIVAKAEASAKSIEKEYEDLGWAAYRRVVATVYGWHAARPTIFGHGMAPGQHPAPSAQGVDHVSTDAPETAVASSNGHAPFSDEEVSS